MVYASLGSVHATSDLRGTEATSCLSRLHVLHLLGMDDPCPLERVNQISILTTTVHNVNQTTFHATFQSLNALFVTYRVRRAVDW